MKVTKLGLDLAWRVNCLPKPKHKNLHLDPQHPFKKKKPESQVPTTCL